MLFRNAPASITEAAHMPAYRHRKVSPAAVAMGPGRLGRTDDDHRVLHDPVWSITSWPGRANWLLSENQAHRHRQNTISIDQNKRNFINTLRSGGCRVAV